MFLLTFTSFSNHWWICKSITPSVFLICNPTVRKSFPFCPLLCWKGESRGARGKPGNQLGSYCNISHERWEWLAPKCASRGMGAMDRSGYVLEMNSRHWVGGGGDAKCSRVIPDFFHEQVVPFNSTSWWYPFIEVETIGGEILGRRIENFDWP